MLVSGFFKVLKLEDGDAQGFERVALCQNLMEEGMSLSDAIHTGKQTHKGVRANGNN